MLTIFILCCFQVLFRRFKGAVALTQTDRINLPKTDVSTLDNGLRVASEEWDTPTASVGVYLDVGSRFETDSNNGVSHFLEHVAFKVSFGIKIALCLKLYSDESTAVIDNVSD